MGNVKRIVSAVVLFAIVASGVCAQESQTENIVIVTLDGYRWQELFKGADKRVLKNTELTSDRGVAAMFDGETDEARREKLMPFFWNTIAREGQLYGNRKYGNKVNCSNFHLLSYPGYSEMLVGFAERKVTSNDLKTNPNPTVLEVINDQEGYKGQVAAFSTWIAFPYILREEKSNIYVNAGTDSAAGNISDREEELNRLQVENKNPHGSRYDEYTHGFAIEYMKREHPRVVFISFDETDEHGHGGRYDQYLKAANKADDLIRQTWEYIQSDPFYKDRTTLLITTDHGRGSGKKSWKNHRLLAPGSGQIWYAVLGPDTPAFGEMKFKGKYYQKQIAKTIAAFLGVGYENRKPVGEIVQTMLAVPAIQIEETVARNGEAGGQND